MDSLNSEQKKLLEEIVKPEKEGYLELYDSEGQLDWILTDLNKKDKKDIIKKIFLLKKTNLSYVKIKLLIKEKNLELLQELEDQHWWLSSEEEKNLEKETVHGKPSNFYKNYGWTLSLVDDCIKKETEDSDRLLKLKRTFDEMGDRESLKGPGRELDDHIMEEISKKLRKSGTKKKKKTKKRTKKKTKKKSKKRKNKKRTKKGTKKRTKRMKGGMMEAVTEEEYLAMFEADEERLAEAERARRLAEAERVRRLAEAERARRLAEAERARRLAEAERVRRLAEVERAGEGNKRKREGENLSNKKSRVGQPDLFNQEGFVDIYLGEG